MHSIQMFLGENSEPAGILQQNRSNKICVIN